MTLLLLMASIRLKRPMEFSGEMGFDISSMEAIFFLLRRIILVILSEISFLSSSVMKKI